jgi:hypothetical protein
MAISNGWSRSVGIGGRNRRNCAIEIKLDETEEIDAKIEQAGIEALDYDARWGRYRLTLHKDDLTKHRSLLKELLQTAYQSRSA